MTERESPTDTEGRANIETVRVEEDFWKQNSDRIKSPRSFYRKKLFCQ